MNSRTKVLHLREDAANFVTKVVQPFTGRCPGAGGSTWNLDGGRKTAQTLCAMVGASEHLRGQDHRRSEAKRHFPEASPRKRMLARLWHEHIKTKDLPRTTSP